MKSFTEVQLEIIHQLSDGACHSGSSIGHSLSISRTAIWKQINQLIELGVPIKRLPQQGYQLSRPFIPLDSHKISRIYQQRADLHIFSEINSTNQFLKELPSHNDITVCCAESQTHGRGRFGRHWISPFGENIYLSYRRQINCCLSRLSGLSLIVSLAVHDCLQRFVNTKAIQIKWPNDLLWQHKKLSGILIEMLAENNGYTQIIIGLGVNVNTATHENTLINTPWCSLHEISGLYFDRNEIIGILLNYLDNYLDEFFEMGVEAFMSRWQAVDYLYGKQITVMQNTQKLTGIADGIDRNGHLLLVDEKGNLQVLSSGDTSLSGFVPD